MSQRPIQIKVFLTPEGYEFYLQNSDGEIINFTMDESAINLLRLALERASRLKNAAVSPIAISEAV